MNKENFIANHVKDLPRSGIRDFFAIVSEMPQAISRLSRILGINADSTTREHAERSESMRHFVVKSV